MTAAENEKPDPLPKNQSSEGLLAAVMDSCQDAIIACDQDGVIRAWNRGAADLYGVARSEAVGQGVSRFIPPERVDECERLAAVGSRGEAVEHFDTVRIRANGEAFPASVSAFPIRDGCGTLIGFGVIERDASERVRAADALRKALSEAQEANAAKSRFLANASHELRTPMNAIVGMTALALEEKLTPELRDYLETIRDSADSMLHLVNDVLDLSKFESEQFELDESPFDPRELVESTVKVLGAAGHAKGLEVVCRVDPYTPARVVGDAVRIRQVITNLVGNAVKFTATGQVVVQLEPLATEASRCTLRFSVLDTGIGIAASDLDRIFTPFTQVDGATTRRYTGTGLGLTISQHLIECFGGSLNVSSSLGEGSNFSFEVTLPITRPPADANAEAAVTRLRGLSVLVADDNDASREALMEQFEAWGMEVSGVGTGDEALSVLSGASASGSPIDVAVIDALMPGTDGFSVASRIQEDKKITAKPILMASTTDRIEFSRRCAEAGAAAFVQKPISQSQLLGSVAQATGAASLQAAERLGLFDRPPVSPVKVLLVEDTPANRKVVQRVLKRRGHKLDVAVNGRDAVDRFRPGEYDIVLMDVQMPIMDGLQATEAIREIEKSKSAPPTRIVAMTAHSMRGDRLRCLRSGMNAYVSKPLDLGQLIDLVERQSVASDGAKGERPEADQNHQLCVEEIGNGEPPLNLDGPLQRLRGDRRLLLDMMGFYLDDAPELVQEVHRAYENESLDVAERAAHSLKGLAATFDAADAIDAAREVELACRSNDQASLADKIERLETAVHQLSKQLSAYRNSSPTG